MNTKETKRPYKAPVAEVILIQKPLSLLVALSAEGGLDDFEQGDDL